MESSTGTKQRMIMGLNMIDVVDARQKWAPCIRTVSQQRRGVDSVGSEPQTRVFVHHRRPYRTEI